MFGYGGIRASNNKIAIIDENNDFIIINKPAGLLTHPTKFNEADTILNRLIAHLGMQGNKHENMPGPVSRLDRDSSGIILFALSKEAKRKLGIMMQKRSFTKKYQCLVKGKIKETGEITIPLKKIESQKKMTGDKNGKESISIYHRLKYFKKNDLSLVEVEIKTGRMHQIRVHFSLINHPIVGDIIYGDVDLNQRFEEKFQLRRHFLHAVYLSWTDDNKAYEYKANLGNKLQKILDHLD